MRVSDRLSGLLAALLGLAVVVQARSLPLSPGQDIGPGLFPSILGGLLILLGAGLIVGSVRKGETGWAGVDDWVARSATRRSLIAVLVALVSWMILVGPVGFIPTTILFLAVLMSIFGARLAVAVPVAVLVTFGTHYAFYTLLRVPLPWGVLKGMEW